MIISRIISLLFLALFSLAAQGQANDTLRGKAQEVEEAPLVANRPHSVSRATWLAVALPSAGQFYNGKYWKMPIVYAGLGVCTYLAIDNNRLYRQYLDAFFKRIDSTQTDQYVGIYQTNQLIVLQNTFRKWRDLAIIIGGVIYALQIIDAHVDAHLYYYDIDESLALKVEPALLNTMVGNIPAVGLGLTLHFK